MQLAELLEVQRDAANSLMNTYLSSVANRQNEVMKVLTVVTSIFIPLSFLTGLYGMNFEYMPELGWRWGYPVLLLVMLLLAARCCSPSSAAAGSVGGGASPNDS